MGDGAGCRSVGGRLAHDANAATRRTAAVVAGDKAAVVAVPRVVLVIEESAVVPAAVESEAVLRAAFRAFPATDTAKLLRRHAVRPAPT